MFAGFSLRKTHAKAHLVYIHGVTLYIYCSRHTLEICYGDMLQRQFPSCMQYNRIPCDNSKDEVAQFVCLVSHHD